MEDVKELVVDETLNAVTEETVTEVAKPKLGKGAIAVGITVLTLGGYVFYKKVIKPKRDAKKAKLAEQAEPTVEETLVEG